MKRPSLPNVNNLGKRVGESDLPIMQDDGVHYDGEPVAVAVADTLEEAGHAALSASSTGWKRRECHSRHRRPSR
jgi:hypothetical protein